MLIWTFHRDSNEFILFLISISDYKKWFMYAYVCASARTRCKLYISNMLPNFFQTRDVAALLNLVILPHHGNKRKQWRNVSVARVTNLFFVSFCTIGIQLLTDSYLLSVKCCFTRLLRFLECACFSPVVSCCEFILIFACYWILEPPFYFDFGLH